MACNSTRDNRPARRHPNDVAAGRDGGARVIAIASGSNTSAELAEAGADEVFEDLTHTDELLSAIYGGQAGSSSDRTQCITVATPREACE